METGQYCSVFANNAYVTGFKKSHLPRIKMLILIILSVVSSEGNRYLRVIHHMSIAIYSLFVHQLLKE